MTAIRMVRKIKGKEKVKEFEDKYKNLQNLQMILESEQGNMLHQLDLENWEHYLENPDEYLEEGKTIFVEGINLGELELDLMHNIKNKQPNSVSELARMVNREAGAISNKVNSLAKNGLISFKHGSKNRKIPILEYDKLEIGF
ncbi:MAG: MarR family transcriptional regulator [Methanobrevibacter sp.]|nr:MarR family transcriptional regulator [Candidatus Methanovirga aequatorialis]